jgi:apolipoprotein D and lipocalin family protein|tara:strand:+ start:872 stop:1420 length:549 start_codon:yes stop_codon:yes gene_type:complete
MNAITIKTLVVISALLVASCTHQPREPMQTASYVDINKFMGDWHVLANIPTFPERGAINPIERYTLNEDGTVDTRFSFINPRNGAERELKATGYIQPDSNNAVWGMQFIWPIKADYRVVYLDPDYQTTIIGRKKRDYLWIMSRDPDLPREHLELLIEMAVQLGYDRGLIQFPERRKGLLATG